MSKILIDEAVVRQAMEDFVVIKYGLEKSRIWGGMDWTYNPIHPVHYLPLRDKAEARMESLNQALADAALEKMAENAREMGLSYEQPDCDHDWKYIGSKRQAMWECTKCGMYKLPDAPLECKTEAEKTAYAFGWYKALESVREEKEPDPDELTIAYMSGVYEGKKRKPWVGLTDEERRACTQSPFTADNYLAIEAKLKEKNS